MQMHGPGLCRLPALRLIWRAGRVSSEMALAPRFQMRGSETVSKARRNGRGPDSSLFVQTRVYMV
jgi:hypothetical protein